MRSIRAAHQECLITNDNCAVEIGESIVCRYEDVTENELKEMLDSGLDSLKQIRLNSRASMGPCQGKTCISLMLRELSLKTKKPVEELDAPKYRQPIKLIKIGSFLDKPKD